MTFSDVDEVIKSLSIDEKREIQLKQLIKQLIEE